MFVGFIAEHGMQDREQI